MKIDKDVLEILNNSEIEGNELRLTGQLDRKMYLKVNEAITALGGKWSKGKKCHLFEGDAKEKINGMIESGTVEDAKSDFNFFPTPKPIVDEMLYRARIVKSMRILEPSAGRGNIALPAMREGGIVDCIELMDNNFKSLLDKGFNSVIQADFLTITPSPIYNRVLMNPPFCRKQDIIHVSHAMKFLAPEGLLLSIMAAGVEFRQDKATKAFVQMVEDKGGYIEALEDGAFKSSGTGVRTVLCVIPA